MAEQNEWIPAKGKEQGRITIGDVAEALGISKTTVSRAISGKGRIGEQTRQRVLAYIEEYNYRPNPMAQGLAQSKTYNIGWVIPGDSTITDLPFFQRCMIGISEVASKENYDILISMVYDHELEHLRRVVENHKVDGIILGRTLIDDECVRFLKEHDIPFVVIGSSNEPDVIQIDNDHVKACRELTSILIMKGIRRLALIGGDENHVVNQTRRQGFEEAVSEQHLNEEDVFVYMNGETKVDIERSVEEALRNQVECIVTMDDRIGFEVINILKRDGIHIPDQIKLASFYSSDLLESNQPAITALQYDPKELGVVACRTLFDMMNARHVDEKVLLSYEVALRGSTQ